MPVAFELVPCPIKHRPSSINHQPPTMACQTSVASNHKLSTIDRLPPSSNHQPPTLSRLTQPGESGGRHLLGGGCGGLSKGSVYAPSFILFARVCIHASSFIFLARIRVCITALVEGIRHHSFRPCLQLGEPSERDGPLDYPIDPCLSST